MKVPQHPATRRPGGSASGSAGARGWAPAASHGHQGHRVDPMGSTARTLPPTSPAPTVQVTLDSPNPPPPRCSAVPGLYKPWSPLCRWSGSRTGTGTTPQRGSPGAAPKTRLVLDPPDFPGFIPTLHSGGWEPWSHPKETVPKLQLSLSRDFSHPRY